MKTCNYYNLSNLNHGSAQATCLASPQIETAVRVKVSALGQLSAALLSRGGGGVKNKHIPCVTVLPESSDLGLITQKPQQIPLRPAEVTSPHSSRMSVLRRGGKPLLA